METKELLETLHILTKEQWEVIDKYRNTLTKEQEERMEKDRLSKIQKEREDKINIYWRIEKYDWDHCRQLWEILNIKQYVWPLEDYIQRESENKDYETIYNNIIIQYVK